MVRLTIIGFVCLAAICALAQQSPELRLNILNVCTPNAADEGELSAALARIPAHPAFAPDYEVARGRTTQKSGTSDWVRLRREFAAEGPVSNVQFLLTMDASGIEETLVFHLRDDKPGDPLQLSFSNRVTAGTAAEVLVADTPPSRIRLERFGKPPLALARCANINQANYEPLFRAAAASFSAYRGALKVRRVVGGEVARLSASGERAKPATSKPSRGHGGPRRPQAPSQ